MALAPLVNPGQILEIKESGNKMGAELLDAFIKATKQLHPKKNAQDETVVPEAILVALPAVLQDRKVQLKSGNSDSKQVQSAEMANSVKTQKGHKLNFIASALQLVGARQSVGKPEITQPVSAGVAKVAQPASFISKQEVATQGAAEAVASTRRMVADEAPQVVSAQTMPLSTEAVTPFALSPQISGAANKETQSADTFSGSDDHSAVSEAVRHNPPPVTQERSGERAAAVSEMVTKEGAIAHQPLSNFQEPAPHQTEQSDVQPRFARSEVKQAHQIGSQPVLAQSSISHAPGATQTTPASKEQKSVNNIKDQSSPMFDRAIKIDEAGEAPNQPVRQLATDPVVLTKTPATQRVKQELTPPAYKAKVPQQGAHTSAVSASGMVAETVPEIAVARGSAPGVSVRAVEFKQTPQPSTTAPMQDLVASTPHMAAEVTPQAVSAQTSMQRASVTSSESVRLAPPAQVAKLRTSNTVAPTSSMQPTKAATMPTQNSALAASRKVTNGTPQVVSPPASAVHTATASLEPMRSVPSGQIAKTRTSDTVMPTQNNVASTSQVITNLAAQVVHAQTPAPQVVSAQTSTPHLTVDVPQFVSNEDIAPSTSSLEAKAAIVEKHKESEFTSALPMNQSTIIHPVSTTMHQGRPSVIKDAIKKQAELRAILDKAEAPAETKISLGWGNNQAVYLSGNFKTGYKVRTSDEQVKQIFLSYGELPSGVNSLESSKDKQDDTDE